MSWLSYLFPQTKLITSTKYNKIIRVNEESGKYKLLVNGSRQSGDYIRKLWSAALKKFSVTSNLPIHSILVLGVAGGTVIHLLHEFYPGAKITGIDIDQVMINIGKQYFGLTEIKELTLINADALDYVNNRNSKKDRYDLVIVDLFIGRIIPEFVSQKDFLTKIKSLLTLHGFVLINYLRELTYGGKSELLSKTLKSLFPTVKDAQIYRNRLFLATGK